MTEQEIILWKEKWKTIVWHKGQLTNAYDYHRQLLKWDKKDSHKEAIQKQLDNIKEIKDTIKNMLPEGYTYETMKSFMAKLNSIYLKYKKAKEQLDKIQF